jgi:hypothetical protein
MLWRRVHDCEQVSEAFGGWQGAYQVHMDVAETACWNWDVLRWYLDVAVDLGPLAAQAGFSPGCDI